MIKRALYLWIIVFTLLSLVWSMAIAKQVEEQAVPKVVSVMTSDIGGGNYAIYGFLGDAMMRKFGTKLRAIPVGNDIGRIIPLRAGEVQFAGAGGDVYFAQQGLDRYATRIWGPQPVLAVWLAQHPGVTAKVRGTSDIKSLGDLKGKKCVWIPGSVMNLHVEAHLAFAGLTWDDVKKVSFPGYGDSMRGVMDGKVDMGCCGTTCPFNYELAGSPYGCRFLPMPSEDKEGWARARKVCPYFTPYKAKIGPNLSEKNSLECAGFAFPITACYPRLDDNIAYFMTRAIHESYDIMANASKMMKDLWKLEQCLSLYESNEMYVFHPGSVRYFKQIGVWKPGWDEIQARRLDQLKKLRSLWEAVVEKAGKEGITDKKFGEYWLKNRAEALGTK